MARNHVFPLTYPTLKSTEVTGVLGDQKPWKQNANIFYFQDEEDEVEITVRRPGQSYAGTLRGVHVTIKNFVGEYLLNYPDEISIPEGPLTSDGSINLSNRHTNFFSENRPIERDPDPGSVICIGIKLGDLPDNMGINGFSSEPAPVYFTRPFDGNFNTDRVVTKANKNSWVTLMWIGTRWVWLGSNNWL